MSNTPNRIPNVIASAGAITPAALNSITAPSAIALSLAAPTVDGLECIIIDETGHAHTITTPANGVNGAYHVITHSGAVGTAIHMFSRNGSWWTASSNGITVS